jgi:HlyD family secretion protein
MIDAPNLSMQLKPGMTALVSVEVARHDDVLRVPSAAVAFKPDAGVVARFAVKGAALPAAKSDVVWVSNGTSIAPVAVKTGGHDAANTEIVGAPFPEGTVVVTRASSSAAPAILTTAASNPGRP